MVLFFLLYDVFFCVEVILKSVGDFRLKVLRGRVVWFSEFDLWIESNKMLSMRVVFLESKFFFEVVVVSNGLLVRNFIYRIF